MSDRCGSRGLRKWYGRQPVLRGVDLDVGPVP